MLKNDSMSAKSAKSNTMKCVSAVRTVLGKHREKSLPSISKSQYNDEKKLSKHEKDSNHTEIKSGIPLKKVYNVGKVELEKLSYTSKRKQDKPKILNKKRQSSNDKKRERGNPKNNQKRSQDKLKQKINQGKESKTPRKRSEKGFSEYRRSHEKTKSSSNHKEPLEHRLSTRIWQIMSRDLFLLDHEKFNSKIQASDSETKRYILNVIKKYNNREIKKQNPPQKTQTSTQSLNSDHASRKMAIKRKVRRQLWNWAKHSIKYNEHWSQFLVDNNIQIENINIDKFDLSLIDVDALGIENKLLKRTIVWLFK